MLVTYQNNFKSVNSQIREVTGYLKKIGNGAVTQVGSYLCNKFGIDAEYYKEWLTSNDVADIAELVVLYLSENLRKLIIADLVAVSAVNN